MAIDRKKAIQIIKDAMPSEKQFSFFVQGNSMRPFINQGTKVIVSTYFTPAQIGIGDIVAIFKENSIIVHRVVFIWKKNGKPYLFFTKGDGNRRLDKPSRSHHILGKIIGMQIADKSINLSQPYRRKAGFLHIFRFGLLILFHKWINY